jgi:hypothetical protein
MNLTETVKLCGMVSELCPKQKFGEYTADAWQLVLDDIPLADAMKAVRTVYRTLGSDEWQGRREIEADDILRQVRRIRAERIDQGLAWLIPPDDCREPGSARYREWSREVRRRLGDGESVESINGPQPELHARSMAALANADSL